MKNTYIREHTQVQGEFFEDEVRIASQNLREVYGVAHVYMSIYVCTSVMLMTHFWALRDVCVYVPLEGQSNRVYLG